ncbi:16384_t:CDS:1, partial [Funneliformis geosporum]
SKYLGPPSEIRQPDFLKTPKYYQGLELDIPYYDYDFAIEVQGSNMKNLTSSFIEAIPIILSNNKHGINSRKNYAKRI